MTGITAIGKCAKRSFAIGFLFCLALARICRAADSGIELKNGLLSATVNPISLEVTFQKSGEAPIVVSVAQTNLGSIGELETTTTNVSWALTDSGMHLEARLEKDGLSMHILADNEGSFTFPVLPGTEPARGWILPMFEGIYAPCDDTQWTVFLTNHSPMDTTADLGLPFIGLDYVDYTLNCIITNQFNNQVHFVPRPDGRLLAALTHQFTPNHPLKEYGIFFQFGSNSPVEPARLYRQWLIRRGEFVSLAEKVKNTPETAKLAGAAHIYLWGDQLIDRSDVNRWPQFVRALKAAGNAPDFTPAKRIWAMLHGDARKAVSELSRAEFLDHFNEDRIAEDLSHALARRDFYDDSFWPDGVSNQQDAALLKTNRAALTLAQVCRINCHLLEDAFPKILSSSDNWGNGLSPKMIRKLALAGFDRLWLGSASWDAFEERPQTVSLAKQKGYLIGPYDSYNSIHSPQETNTWETAQFDGKLYLTGAIIQQDGTAKLGFKQKGYLLSPIAAQPYMEKRVTQLMDIFHANSWFMDCDGFGQFYDDYSATHPATQQTDMLARIARMAWIRDYFGAVIGTECCSAGVAGTVHFAHGVMTPVIGWGDEDMTDKKSKYFIGRYYPEDGPEVFFKPVPIKDEYRHIYFDPAFRLPLFETVFHDSVVATHHWSFASFKTRDDAGAMELLELLYGVPPLYHLNLDEFQKRESAIKRHYGFFSPLHREIFELPMTNFKWLTDDRLVQQTTFGDKIILTSNFGVDDFRLGDQVIPKQSIMALWKVSGKTEVYSIETPRTAAEKDSRNK